MATPLTTAYQNKILALTSAQREACIATLTAANIGFERDGALDLWVSNNNAQAQTIIDTSTLWLTAAKALKQAALDDQFDSKFDLTKFIRGGTATTITATNVGNFLAQITNNYRTLRAQIAAASTVAIVQAIDITAGWPANP
jgi:hypothetical protein